MAQTPASTFANAGAIMINDLATATPYPSVVNVSGLTGSLVKVTLQLNRFNHTCPFDVAMALVAPNGTWIVPMNSAGGCLGATDVNLQFADGCQVVARTPDRSELLEHARRSAEGTADVFDLVVTGDAGTVHSLRRDSRGWPHGPRRVVGKAYWAPGRTGLD